MYQPYQVLRASGPEGMTPAEQRAADEQLGRIAAGLSRSWRHGAERVRALADLLVLAVYPSAFFRKLNLETLRGQAPARPACPQAVPETVAKTGFGIISQPRR